HPAASAGIGDLHAAAQNWERAIPEYRQGIAHRPADAALLTKLAAAYQSAGRTREAVPHLATPSSAHPRDTALALGRAARQAWFGMDRELAAHRQRILSLARGTNEAALADCAAKACSLSPSTDKAEQEAALALGRTGVKVAGSQVWNLLSLGMAEYRGGDYAAADQTLFTATEAARNLSQLTNAAALYRAMSLFRLGKENE